MRFGADKRKGESFVHSPPVDNATSFLSDDHVVASYALHLLMRTLNLASLSHRSLLFESFAAMQCATLYFFLMTIGMNLSKYCLAAEILISGVVAVTRTMRNRCGLRWIRPYAMSLSKLHNLHRTTWPALQDTTEILY